MQLATTALFVTMILYGCALSFLIIRVARGKIKGLNIQKKGMWNISRANAQTDKHGKIILRIVRMLGLLVILEVLLILVILFNN